MSRICSEGESCYANDRSFWSRTRSLMLKSLSDVECMAISAV